MVSVRVKEGSDLVPRCLPSLSRRQRKQDLRKCLLPVMIRICDLVELSRKMGESLNGSSYKMVVKNDGIGLLLTDNYSGFIFLVLLFKNNPIKSDRVVFLKLPLFIHSNLYILQRQLLLHRYLFVFQRLYYYSMCLIWML